MEETIMNFKNLRLKTKIILGIGVPLVLALILGIISITNIRTIIETGEWVEHTHNVIGKAENIIASAVDMETGMRGYLLAGKEDFLKPYENGETVTYEVIKSLQETVSDNPAQVERLGEVEKILREWQENVTEPTITLRREIGDAETMNDMAELVKEARGKVYFDKFRGQIATFIAREEALMAERQKASEEATVENEANAKLITETTVWVEHTHGVIATANEILAAAVDMETGMRGYLLAGKEEFLDPYKAGQKEFSELVASLSKTVDDNPAQVELLGEVKTTIEEWQEQVTEPAIALRRKVGFGTGTTMDDVATLVGQANGKVYFDKFRDQIATFIAREEALMAERQKSAEEATAAAAANRKLISDTTVWVNHTQQVIEETNHILATAVDMETGMRGYLLAGKEDFLEPYTAGQEEFAELVASLSKTVDDNPAQVELLGDIKTTIDEWQEQVATPTIELRGKIGDAKTMDDMAHLVGEARGKQYFDKFRGVMVDFVGEEQDLMKTRQEANASTVSTTITTIIVCIIAAVIIGVFVTFFVTRDIQRQVGGEPAIIAGIAKEVSEGNLSIAVDEGKATGILAALVEMVRVLNTIVTDIKGVADNVAAGRIDARGNASAFAGGWRELVVGVNNVVDAFVAPINVTAEYLDRIARGDIPNQITEEYKGDFNLIKNNLNMLIDAMNEMTGLAEEMAEGDLTVKVKERSAQDRLMQALNAMIQRLSEVVTNVKGAADNVASGGQAMSSSSEEMSQGATEQAAAAEEASSSMEQMAANIRQNSDNALQTEKIAVKAAEDAREGGKAVAETVAAMQDIVKKISIIEEIARQTHMLSLNATIEAAKAQDYGKGFGVVASEVRALAERAQSAAVEINAVASDSVTVAEKAGEMLHKLVPDIQKTAELVQEINAASNEQNTGAGQINRAIQQLDNVIQQNASSSEEIAATAEELSSQAEQLQNTITFFKVAETTWRSLDHREQAMGAVHPQSVTGTGILAQGKKASGNIEKGKGDGRNSSSAGYVVDMGQNEQGKDNLDDEFERY